MINAVLHKNNRLIIVKTPLKLKLKPITKLEKVKIFAMPTKIKSKDINSMFNGVLALLNEKVKQEQSEKYLNLQLKYTRLQMLYNNLKKQLLIKKI